MSFQEEVFHVFDAQGEIKQVSYGLEAVYSSYPIVTVRGTNTIFCASKKVPLSKLRVDKHSSVHQISQGVYVNITGRQADVGFAIDKMRSVASDIEYSIGMAVTPDVVAKAVADKIQVWIQRTVKRLAAFAACICGFDGDRPLIHYVDMSAVEYPCMGATAGEHFNDMNKFLEKNYVADDERIKEIGVETLLKAIGKEADPDEIEAAIITPSGMTHLSQQEIESLLLSIVEKQ